MAVSYTHLDVYKRQALGMGVILFTMILNMITSFKNHNTEKTWFDTNGLAGFVFYFSLAATIVMFMSGHTLPAAAILIIMFVLPLLVMFFKEPLTAVLEKKSEKISGGVGTVSYTHLTEDMIPKLMEQRKEICALLKQRFTDVTLDLVARTPSM